MRLLPLYVEVLALVAVWLKDKARRTTSCAETLPASANLQRAPFNRSHFAARAGDRFELRDAEKLRPIADNALRPQAAYRATERHRASLSSNLFPLGVK